MFYCEIDKDGLCYHSTISELPVSDTIILSEEDKIGMIWDGEKWNEPEVEALEEPTQEELQWQAITDLEIGQMEYSQALTDLEIKYLEGGIKI